MVDIDSSLDPALNSLGVSPRDTDGELLGLLPRIRNFFRRRVAAFDADDLTQEVYLHVLGRSSKDVIHNMGGYLLAVAANVLHEKNRGDRVRSQAAHVELHDHDSSETNTPERIVLQRDQIQVMVGAIEALPPRTRDAFLLHRFEDMTYDDIARTMGISPSGVEKHIMKALRLLTLQFKETGA